MTASTKDLIERARFAEHVLDERVIALLDELADALERLTQPVGVEPVAWYDKTTGLPYGWQEVAPTQNAEFLYSAETVARLIAEREDAYDKGHSDGVAAMTRQSKFSDTEAIDLVEEFSDKCDALQEQVKVLRDAAAPYLDPYFKDEKPTTYACHHNTETCPSCEGLVKRWKYQKALREALAATEPKRMP